MRSGGRRRSGPWRTSRSRAAGLERAHIAALARIKAAAALVNADLGVIPADVADAIAAAAGRVVRGEHDDQFPIDVFQTGSGTSSNMNANEVIATLADRSGSGADVHPNDMVNASQSSNDVFPSSIHLAAAEAWPAIWSRRWRIWRERWRRRRPSGRRWSRPGVRT